MESCKNSVPYYQKRSGYAIGIAYFKAAMHCLQAKPYKYISFIRQKLFHVAQFIVWLHNNA